MCVCVCVNDVNSKTDNTVTLLIEVKDCVEPNMRFGWPDNKNGAPISHRVTEAQSAVKSFSFSETQTFYLEVAVV